MRELFLRIPPDLHSAITELAKREHRSANKQATHMLLVALNLTRQHGNNEITNSESAR